MRDNCKPVGDGSVLPAYRNTAILHKRIRDGACPRRRQTPCSSWSFRSLRRVIIGDAGPNHTRATAWNVPARQRFVRQQMVYSFG